MFCLKIELNTYFASLTLLQMSFDIYTFKKYFASPKFEKKLQNATNEKMLVYIVKGNSL